jgi:hypothetical protein
VARLDGKPDKGGVMIRSEWATKDQSLAAMAARDWSSSRQAFSA